MKRSAEQNHGMTPGKLPPPPQSPESRVSCEFPFSEIKEPRGPGLAYKHLPLTIAMKDSDIFHII